MLNKDSALAQYQVIEDNLRRLRTLLEADMVGIGPDINVELYCLEKIKLQADNLQKELTSLYELTKKFKPEITHGKD